MREILGKVAPVPENWKEMWLTPKRVQDLNIGNEELYKFWTCFNLENVKSLENPENKKSSRSNSKFSSS